jgi:phosphoglycolate phosphatase
MNKVVIFDFDGTIADTFSTVVEIVNSLSDEFEFEKLGMEEIAAMRHLRAQEVIKIFRISLLKIPSFLVRVKSLLNEQVKFLKPFEGIKESLDELKSNGCRLGILSSNNIEIVQAFLDNNKIDQFEFVKCEKNIFGKAAILKKIIEEYGFDRENVVYVGDETRDVEAAHKAKIKIVSVDWGFNSVSAIEKLHPEKIISHPRELTESVVSI